MTAKAIPPLAAQNPRDRNARRSLVKPPACAGSPHRKIGLSLADLARQINPIVRGWMQYYGGVLPLRDVSAPIPHQRLPDAVDPQEIQTVAPDEEGRGLLATPHQPAPPALRPLGMGARFLVVRMTRAR
jgi:hypothetical protein